MMRIPLLFLEHPGIHQKRQWPNFNISASRERLCAGGENFQCLESRKKESLTFIFATFYHTIWLLLGAIEGFGCQYNHLIWTLESWTDPRRTESISDLHLEKSTFITIRASFFIQRHFMFSCSESWRSIFTKHYRWSEKSATEAFAQRSRKLLGPFSLFRNWNPCVEFASLAPDILGLLVTGAFPIYWRLNDQSLTCRRATQFPRMPFEVHCEIPPTMLAVQRTIYLSSSRMVVVDHALLCWGKITYFCSRIPCLFMCATVKRRRASQREKDGGALHLHLQLEA